MYNILVDNFDKIFVCGLSAGFILKTRKVLK